MYFFVVVIAAVMVLSGMLMRSCRADDPPLPVNGVETGAVEQYDAEVALLMGGSATVPSRRELF